MNPSDHPFVSRPGGARRLETVVFCGFTPQEQAELSVFADSVA